MDGPFFRDASGGAVLLRGVNVAPDSKRPPFRAITDPAQLDPLEAWGLNVVRLLFLWEAYEPTPGAYDASYLAHVREVADWAWARGLHVIVDFHQDGFSRFSIGGCGSGFPAWTIPFPVFPDVPDNGPSCSGWVAAMPLDLDMHFSWNRFYADAGGARSGYLAVLSALAQHLSGHPGVVGYDLLNEPWGDEPTEIAPLHAEAVAAIRQHDPGAIVFVTPHVLTTVGTQTQLPVPGFANFSYSPHYYDVTVNTLGFWSGLPPDLPFAVMTGKAAEWGVPMLLGEFGAPATTLGGLGFLDSVYRRLDADFASATQWAYTPSWSAATLDGWNGEDFSIADGTGAPRGNFRARPYARRISGTPLAADIVAAGAVRDRFVELSWDHDPATGSTELFVPRQSLFGSNPIAFALEGDGLVCAFDAGETIVTCESAAPGAKSVRIAPTTGCGLSGIEIVLVSAALALRRRRGR